MFVVHVSLSFGKVERISRLEIHATTLSMEHKYETRSSELVGEWGENKSYLRRHATGREDISLLV